MSAPRFPDPPAGVPATPFDLVDRQLERLASRKDAWTRVPIEQRARYLKAIERGIVESALPWGAACARAAGFAPDDDLAGEGLIAGPYITLRCARQYRYALEQRARPKVAIKTRKSGQQVADVLPYGLTDSLLFPKVKGEVWLEPGADPTQGRIYRAKEKEPGKVALVLGAGNISSIPPTDALHKLFVEDEVVVLKMNPVNAYVGPYLEQMFRPLIDDGFLAVVYGGADVGKHLCAHPLVDTLHITGSDKTYDAIVWGDGAEEQAKNKAAGKRRIDKPFTSELGNVTPVLVVPGRYSDADIDFQARHIAASVAHNASFDCVAGKVLVVADGWDQRDQLIARVKQKLKELRPRKAYYPGAEQRWQRFMTEYPAAEVLGETGEGVVPWTYIAEVKASRDSYAVRTEAFCGVLAEVNLPATSTEEFLDVATRFANEELWGTLACFLVTGGDTHKRDAGALDRAIEELRYGTVGVNIWPGAGFGFVNPTWGAFPGHSDDDIQSGRGTVHNSLLLDHPQKTVLRAPPKCLPITPPWFSDHKNLLKSAKAMMKLEASYSPLSLTAALPSLLKG